MNILIVAATTQEIESSLPFLKEKGIPYVITGVGMVAATYTIAKALQQQKVDLMIQVGIGGILDHTANMGSIYRITEDRVFDFGAENRDAFIPMEDLGFGRSVFYENCSHSNPVLAAVPGAAGITVNKVHGKEESITQLSRRYQATLVESMEGVSAFFVAAQENVAVLQFRAISNYIEPRNRSSWQIGLAIKNLNRFLQELLMSLS